MASFNEIAALAGATGTSMGQLGQLFIGAAGGDPTVLNPAIAANQGTQQAAIEAEEEERRKEEERRNRRIGNFSSIGSTIGQAAGSLIPIPGASQAGSAIGAGVGAELGGGDFSEAATANLGSQAQGMMQGPQLENSMPGLGQAKTTKGPQTVAEPKTAEEYQPSDQLEIADPYTGKPRQFRKTQKGWSEIFTT